MYFQDLSTRNVREVMESLYGFDLTSTEVSRSAMLLDEEFEKWRERKLGRFVYIYLDTMYEKVRYGGCVQDCAVLLAIGINTRGCREILGLSIKLSEPVGVFPNTASCERLISSVLIEINDDWLTGKKYLTFQNLYLKN